MSSLNLAQKIIFLELALSKKAPKSVLLIEELCSLSESKLQQIQTVKEVKCGNMVQKFKFYAHKVSVQEAAVSISFSVASVFYTLLQGCQ